MAATQSQYLVNLSLGLSFQSNLRPDNRVSSSSCETTRTNRSWVLSDSLKVEKFRPQRGRRRGLTCFGSFENGGLLRNGVGDSDGVIIVDHGSRRRESNLMLEEFVKMFKDKTGYSIVEPAHMYDTIMDKHALDEEALIIPEGPVTRSKTRKLAGAVQELLKDVRIKEKDQLMQNAVTSISATIFS